MELDQHAPLSHVKTRRFYDMSNASIVKFSRYPQSITKEVDLIKTMQSKNILDFHLRSGGAPRGTKGSKLLGAVFQSACLLIAHGT